MDKIFLNANELLNDGFELGYAVLESGYKPDLLLALWRGGAPVAVAVDELLTFKEITHEHFAVRTKHYTGIDQRQGKVDIYDRDALLAHVKDNQRILIVDDVYDTGLSVSALIEAITGTGKQVEIRTAVPWFKPDNNKTSHTPDYWLHSTDKWIVFPHELVGLNDTDIAAKPALPALQRLLGEGFFREGS